MTSSAQNSKVARVIERYDLDGMGEQLEEAWTRDQSDRKSLRDLADEFNRTVLNATLRRSDRSVSKIDCQSIYKTLTGDDVSSAEKMRKVRELNRWGIDAEELQSDFVTHQAIHSYLTNYRGVELSDKSGDIDQKIDRLERLQGRTTVVTESTISEAVISNQVTDRPYKVIAEVRVICQFCGTSYAASELLRKGGCNCD